jgi:NADP-dependent 3-hydroxy acid dehydrogenase YdfG
MENFKDQIAIVTGASSGIGKAVALSLAERGATVCLVARRAKVLEEVAALNRSELRPFPTNLAKYEDVNKLIAALRSEFKHIDIIVHSAADYVRGPVSSAPLTDFERLYRINVLAPYALTQALLPALPPQHGQIVFVNSSAGLAAPEGLSQYAATKHALKAIADSLRKEVNKHGIRVLSVYLGRTATPLQAAVHAMEHKSYRPENLMQAEDVAGVIMHALSLPRSAEVTEIQMRQLQRQ